MFREPVSGGLDLGYELVFRNTIHCNLKPGVLRVDSLHVINQSVLDCEDSRGTTRSRIRQVKRRRRSDALVV